MEKLGSMATSMPNGVRVEATDTVTAEWVMMSRQNTSTRADW